MLAELSKGCLKQVQHKTGWRQLCLAKADGKTTILEGKASIQDDEGPPPASLSQLTLPRCLGHASRHLFAWKSHQGPTPQQVQKHLRKGLNPFSRQTCRKKTNLSTCLGIKHRGWGYGHQWVSSSAKCPPPTPAAMARLLDGGGHQLDSCSVVLSSHCFCGGKRQCSLEK